MVKYVCHFSLVFLALFLTINLPAAEQDNPGEQVHYVSYHQIFPAQLRYSSQNVTEKVGKAISKGNAAWNEKENKWILKYDEGKSILSEKEALPVVLASFGYVLADGHHDVLSSIQLQAEMIPVRVIADLSQLEIEDFWKEAEKKGWAYLYAIGGQRSLPPQYFTDLQDDLNRYFAAITARKYVNEDMKESSGAEYPLWIKIGKDIPFIEFKISDVLWMHGLIYNEDLHGNPPTEEFVELARKVLLEANIEGLRVVPERTYFKDL